MEGENVNILEKYSRKLLVKKCKENLGITDWKRKLQDSLEGENTTSQENTK